MQISASSFFFNNKGVVNPLLCSVSHQANKHDSFESFVTTPPLEGLGTTVRHLRNICRDDPEALDTIDRVTVQHGKNQHTKSKDHDNIIVHDKPSQGTSREYALRRLRKDRPDLHERVLSGELSAHAAMVEAGFRKKPDPFRVASNGLKKLSRSELLRLKGEIEELLQDQPA